MSKMQCVSIQRSSVGVSPSAERVGFDKRTQSVNVVEHAAEEQDRHHPVRGYSSPGKICQRCRPHHAVKVQHFKELIRAALPAIRPLGQSLPDYVMCPMQLAPCLLIVILIFCICNKRNHLSVPKWFSVCATVQCCSVARHFADCTD